MNEDAKGEFVVKLLPLPVEGLPENSKMGRMSIDKSISGDLLATTRGQMLSAMTDVKGVSRVRSNRKGRRDAQGQEGNFRPSTHRHYEQRQPKPFGHSCSRLWNR